MTPKTRAMFEDNCSKLSLAVAMVSLEQCEPIDLFTQAEMWLLLLESFERLTAVVVEGTGMTVEWANP